MKKVISQIKDKIQGRTVVIAFIAVFLFLYVPVFISELRIYITQKNNYEEHLLPVLGSDSIEYKTLAENISSKGCFALIDCDKPEIFRTPGYPFFIYVVKTAFGSYFSVVFLQAILAVISGFLIYKIASLYLPLRASAYLGLLFTIDPTVILHSFILLSDISYVFLIVLAVYLFLSRPYNFTKMVLITTIISASVYIRPISIYLVFLFLLFSVIPLLKSKRIYSDMLFCFLIFILIISPWVIRNKLKTNTPSFSIVTSYNIFYYNVPMFLSYKSGLSEEDERNRLITNSGLSKNKLFSPESQDVMMRTSQEILLSQPISYFKFHVLKTASFFFGSSIKNAKQSLNTVFSNDTDLVFDTDIYSYIKTKDFLGLIKNTNHNLLITIERVLWGIVFILSFIPILIGKHRREFFFMFVIVWYFAILTGPVSYVRYRLPSEPFLLILSAIGLYYLIKIFLSSTLQKSNLQK